jgi:hypothetical protein
METTTNIEKQLSPENLAKFRNSHTIQTSEQIPVSPEAIHMESGAGNYVIIPKNDNRVVRVVQYKDSDSRMRIDSPTMIAVLQEIEPKAKFYFPVIYGFAKADIEKMQAPQDSSIILYKHTDDKYDTKTNVPASVVERIPEGEGWSIKFSRAIKHEDGMIGVITQEIETIKGEVLDLDAENTVRTMYHLMQAERMLSQYGRYLADFKGSFAVHTDENGKVDRLKIMDMDEKLEINPIRNLVNLGLRLN